jgi:hypothetical protein
MSSALGSSSAAAAAPSTVTPNLFTLAPAVLRRQFGLDKVAGRNIRTAKK